jgi:hypothetical protein
MPYVVKRPRGRYELRESAATSRGPRSRTLASFRELTPEVLEHALERARTPASAEDVYAAARRAGVPVPLAPADAAAATLLSQIDRGRSPSARLARALTAALRERGADREPPTDDERAAAPWIAATAAERGEALRELLLLTDSLPASRAGELRFPPVRTRTA